MAAAVTSDPGAVAVADARLVALVRSGDDGAFAELYARYQPRLHGFATRLLRDPARAEDVIQDSFLAALRRLRETDSPVDFRPWMFEIVRNGSIDALRRAGRTELIPLDDGPFAAHDAGRLAHDRGAPLPVVLSKETLAQLRTAFEELTDTQLRVLVLRELEGRSYDEIARTLGITRAAVESTLFRARRDLGRLYEEIDSGRRCAEMAQVAARLAEGIESRRDRRRLERHARRCASCRRRAAELGVEVHGRRGLAALLPLPFIRRPRGADAPGAAPAASTSASSAGFNHALGLGPMVSAGGEAAVAGWGKAAAVLGALVLAGGGAVHGTAPSEPVVPSLPPAADGLRELFGGAAGPLGPSPASFTPAPPPDAVAAAGAAGPGGAGEAGTGEAAAYATGPGAPGVPGASGEPAIRGSAEGPSFPDTPDSRSLPDAPSAPSAPRAPDAPSAPDAPRAPEAPAPPSVQAPPPSVDPPSAPEAPSAPEPPPRPQVSAPQAPAAPTAPDRPATPAVSAAPPDAGGTAGLSL